MPPKRKKQAGRPALARGRPTGQTVTAPDRSPQPKPKPRVRKPRVAPDPKLRRTTRAMARIEGSTPQEISQVANVIPSGIDRTAISKPSECSQNLTPTLSSTHVPEAATPSLPISDVQSEIHHCERGSGMHNVRASSQSSFQSDVVPEGSNEGQSARADKGGPNLGHDNTPLVQPTGEHQAARGELIEPQLSHMGAEAAHEGSSHPPEGNQPLTEGNQPLTEGNQPLTEGEAAPSPQSAEDFTAHVSNNEAEAKRWLDEAFDYQAVFGLFWGRWRALDSRLAGFAASIFPCIALTRVEWRSLDSRTKAKLLSLTPKAERYLENEYGAPDCLFKAWIWQLLVNNLFSPDCVDKWTGPEWAAFGKLDRAFRGDVTNSDNPFNFYFHGARERMARMLYMKYGSHANKDRLKEIILSEIAPLTRYKNSPSGEASHISEISLKALDEVIELAVAIDLVIVGCRYHVVVEMNHPVTGQAHGFLYEQRSSMMERFRAARAGSKRKRHHGRPIDLIMRPSIRAYGERLDYYFGKTAGDRELVWPPVRRYNLCKHEMPILVCVDQFPPNEKTEHLDPDDRTDTEYHDSDEEDRIQFLREYALQRRQEQIERERRENDETN